jgi:hypothetical protein
MPIVTKATAAQAARLKAAEAALQKQAAAASEVNEALLLNLGTNSQASRMLRACHTSTRMRFKPPPRPPLNRATLVELEPEFGVHFAQKFSFGCVHQLECCIYPDPKHP